MHIPDRNECEDKEGKEHLEIGVWCKPDATQHQQLYKLKQCERVHLPLGYSPYVMIGRICRLRKEENFVFFFLKRGGKYSYLVIVS